MMTHWLSNTIAQLRAFWDQFNNKQKIVISSAGIILTLILGFILLLNNMTSYSLLFSPDRMQNVDIAEIKTYLDNANIPYKSKNDSLILVPTEKVHQIRMELAVYGLPKIQSSKGLEIFDNTAWVKGEKELQMLEIRAIKGQLEKDISQFDNIRSANVILDIPPQRAFGDSTYKTKASVILNLMPGGRLSPQEVRAITYHVAGAVRGLSANMIAISDTTGKLYQAFDPDGALDAVRLAETSLEDHIKAKVDGLLATVVGFDNFYSTVQIQMSRNTQTQERKVYSGNPSGVNLGEPVISNITEFVEQKPSVLRESKQVAVPSEEMKTKSSPGKVESISIGALIDKNLLSEPLFMGVDKEQLQKNIENQIENILKAYQGNNSMSVDFVDFHHPLHVLSNSTTTVYTEKNLDILKTLLYFALTLLLLLFILLSVVRSKRQYMPKYVPVTPYTQPKNEPVTQNELSLSAGEINHLKEILHNASSNDLADFLSKCRTAHATSLLIGTSANRAAKVFSSLPDDRRQEIFLELIKMSPDQFKKMAYSFGNEISSMPEYIEDFLKHLPEANQQQYLNLIQQKNRELYSTLNQDIHQR